MPACELEPADKKQLISDVGEELVKRHGKKDYYQPEQVRKAASDRGYSIDYVCWAYVIFTSAEDFQLLHEAAGEVCDYAAMKAAVLVELSEGGAFDWMDIDLSWLRWPDIDLSETFDWFDFTN